MEFKNDTIESERLYLYPVMLKDVGGYYKFCRDREVCRYLTFNPYHLRYVLKQTIINMIRAQLENRDIHYTIVKKDIGKIVGSISLSRLNDDDKAFEIGIMINRKYWHQHIASEALKAIENQAFRDYDVERLIAKYIKDNVASAKLFEKSGYKIYRTVKDGFIKNKKTYDLVYVYKKKIG